MANAVRDAEAGRPSAGLQPRGPRGHLRAVSGAGKSSAMNVFEDAGYFCVDNLPAEMIRSLSELFMHEGSKVERAAVVCDSRGGEYLSALAGVIDQLAAAGVVHRVVFLGPTRGAGDPLQGDAPPAPALAARQRGRRHPGRAGAARARPPARGHRDRHERPERRRAAPQGRRRAARAVHARQARGHVHVLRAQARAAARRGPRVRRALPPEPALRRRPAAADRLRPADRGLRRPRRAPRGVLRPRRCRCWSSCCRSTWPRARRT